MKKEAIKSFYEKMLKMKYADVDVKGEVIFLEYNKKMIVGKFEPLLDGRVSIEDGYGMFMRAIEDICNGDLKSGPVVAEPLKLSLYDLKWLYEAVACSFGLKVESAIDYIFIKKADGYPILDVDMKKEHRQYIESEEPVENFADSFEKRVESFMHLPENNDNVFIRLLDKDDPMLNDVNWFEIEQFAAVPIFIDGKNVEFFREPVSRAVMINALHNTEKLLAEKAEKLKLI